MHPVETAIVDAFIAPHRQERWRISLASTRRRTQFLDCLNHCRDLDPRYARPLASNVDVLALLRSHGAPDRCYVLSAADELDSREMTLAEAVSDAAMLGWGTIISCIPGRLGYYHDEQGERRYLLVRELPAD
jgi:hypothetical protein